MDLLPFVDIHFHHDSDLFGIQNFDYWKDTSIPNRFFSFGAHPWYASEFNQLASKNQIWDHPMCLALGETGLDALRGEKLEHQINLFTLQLMECHLPILVHLVRHEVPFLQIVKSHPDRIFVVHGFRGNVAKVNRFLLENVMISIGSSVFYDSTATDVVRMIPIKQLLLETDEQNVKTIEEIYQRVAEIRQMDLPTLKREIYRNFVATFKKYGTQLASENRAIDR